MEFEKIEVKEFSTLNELKNDSALTIEGLLDTNENLESFLEWVAEKTELNKNVIYVTKGSLMNEYCKLSEDDKYDDDLSIVSIKLSDMKNPQAIVLKRFAIGARWMDDIISNNINKN